MQGDQPGYCNAQYKPETHSNDMIVSEPERLVVRGNLDRHWTKCVHYSTNQKPTIYRNLYENTAPGVSLLD